MAGAGGLQLTLLGGFRLESDGLELRLPSASERVLAFLGLQEHPPTRTHVAGNLWPNTTDAKAAANLRSALWRIRQVGPTVVETYGHHVQLADDVVVDVEKLVELAGVILDWPADRRVPDVGIDLSRFARELLPGFWDSWLVLERERIRQLALCALERLGDLLLARGQDRQAVLAGLAAVGADPLRESANLLLVRAHLACGNRSEATRQVNRYRAQLHRDLAIDPSPLFADMLSLAD